MLYTIAPSIATAIADATAQNGGASFTIDGQDRTGTDAYAVSIYPDRERIVDGTATADDIADFAAANHDVLADGRAVIGTWVHEGRTYLDVSALVSDRLEALRLGEQHGQLAIFDLATLEEIPCTVHVGVAA
jgi:hypothetical protein